MYPERRKENSVYYLSVFQWPEDGKLAFDTKYTVKEAMLLADGTKLKFTKNARRHYDTSSHAGS